MELTEPIESINNQLIDLFGVDTVTGLPIWRVVWSEDQFEKRLGTFTDYSPAGLYIRTVTEVREVPKYRQWIQEKYVLEQLSGIPDANADELPTQKLSYEPLFIFEDKNGFPLPPKIEVCKIVVDSVYAVQGKSSLAKYIENPTEEKRKSVESIYQELYGDETDITDSLRYGTAITVPNKGES